MKKTPSKLKGGLEKFWVTSGNGCCMLAEGNTAHGNAAPQTSFDFCVCLLFLESVSEGYFCWCFVPCVATEGSPTGPASC